MQWPGSNNRVRINWAMNIKIDQNKQLFEIFRIFFNIIKKIQYLLHKFCIWMQTKNLTLEEEKNCFQIECHGKAGMCLAYLDLSLVHEVEE